VPDTLVPVTGGEWTDFAPYSHAYLPLTEAELGAPFPVRARKLPSLCPEALDLPVGPNGARWTADEEGTVRLTGTDRQGRTWTLDPGPCGTGHYAHLADLDADGTPDLLFANPTGGNGLAPTTVLEGALFDPEGRPVPFRFVGYFGGVDGQPLADVTDADGDGHAELLVMGFSDGYWYTDRYEADAGHWQRVPEGFGGRTYPLFTRFTDRPNRRAVRPARGRSPFVPNLATEAPLLDGRLTAFAGGTERVPRLTINDAHGEATTCDAPMLLVRDTPNGREIVRMDEAAWTRLAGMTPRLLLFGHLDVRYEEASPCAPVFAWMAER